MTQQQKEQKIQKLQNELDRLNRKQLKPMVGRYLIIMLIMVTLNFCIDIFGSNIHGIMKADALNNLLSGVSKDKGFQIYENTTLIFGALSMLILPFYKSLTDRYGRKPFLILNTLITAAGMGIMMFSNHLIVYIIGFVISSIGYQGDVHQIFILESAPDHLRARFASATKAISVLSSSLLGVFKLAFQSEAVPQSWRNVFIVPVIAGLTVGILSCFLTQETEKFTENRKSALKQEIQSLAGQTVETEEKRSTMSFRETLVFIFKHRQSRMLFFSACLFCGAMAYVKPYSLILEGSTEQDAVAVVSIIYPFIEGLFSLIGGVIADKLGRKISVVANGILFIVAYVFFIVGFKMGLPIVLIAIAYGLVCGGYWAGRDILGTTMISESVPTQSRATIVGIFVMITSACSEVSGAILSNIPALLHFDLSYTYLVGCSLLMAGALLIAVIGVGETKNNSLDTVTGAEFDR